MNDAYKFRNLPCNIKPDDKLWCVSGMCINRSAGILEWCYDQQDAEYRMELMLKDARFSNLSAHKFLEPV